MATLDLITLSKRFDTSANSVNAVNAVSLNVNDGEFLCILGPSGCGKSTALRMIGGFETPTSGDILIDQQSVIHLPPNKRPTAMVFQKYTLWPHMRVYDNIAFGLRLRGLDKSVVDREVLQSLDLVGLSAYSQRYPAQLSGGEQQRVALARSLVLKPKILLLDEPFSSLDALLRVRLREELKEIQRRVKITAIFVTHDQEEALTLADRIAIMNKGNVEQVGAPPDVYARPRTLFVADFVGAMNLITGTAEHGVIRIGTRRLKTASGLQAGAVNIAIRPEDFLVTDNGNAWAAQVTQVTDLGHYRKALVQCAELGDKALKLYLPKSASLQTGQQIYLTPTRFLVYQNGLPPIEVSTI